MKYKIILHLFIYPIIYFFFSGCSSGKNKTDLIQFDVSISYPVKEVALEKIADIEYLQLLLDDDFLFKVAPDVITTDKIIFSLFREGDILIFSRDGKPLSKFNHKGDGPEDYVSIRQLLYDEKLSEFFVRTHNKIVVYNESGIFKRIIPLLEDASIFEIVNFDSNTLLIYDDSNIYPAPFCLISKEDGRIVKAINTPNSTNKADLTTVIQKDNNGLTHYYYPPAYHIVKYKNGYLLNDYLIDSIYFLSSDKKLSPILTRKPEILSMEPMISLNGFIEADDYEFFLTIKYKVDNAQLPKTYLMRDKKTGTLYKQKITLNTYKGKEIMLSPETITNTKDDKVGLIILNLEELREANKENRISGKLKQLVEDSNEEGNDIFMLLHFK